MQDCEFYYIASPISASQNNQTDLFCLLLTHGFPLLNSTQGQEGSAVVLEFHLGLTAGLEITFKDRTSEAIGVLKP